MTAKERISSVSSGLVWPFVKLALQQRCDALVATCGFQLDLDPLLLEHSNIRLPLVVVTPLLSELASTMGTKRIGIVAAQLLTTKHVGLAEFLARSKDTLGAAITSSIRYASLLCDGVHRSIETHDDDVHVRFWFDESLSNHDTVHEFTLALLLTCARRITQMPNLRPTEVHFVHARPDDLTLHEQHFRCDIRFGMPVASLVFPAQLMDLPLPAAEPTLSSLLDQHAAHTLAGRPRAKRMVPQVREMLAAEMGVRRPSATRIAHSLGISPRTLARHLRSEQTSFQQLFDDARRDRAMRELRETTRSIRAIATQLGFCSSQSFHRAFRRWTGTTAMTFRAAARRPLPGAYEPSDDSSLNARRMTCACAGRAISRSGR